MLSPLDWSIIIGYNILSLLVGIAMTRRAHKSTEEYFLAGRALPWWIAGTSMVATSFSCDTPLYVTKLVRTMGIYENWQWWCFGIGSLFSAFFLAPLWRRAKVLTDVELTELRYGHTKITRGLRGFRALWLALPINVIAMGWVFLALAKIMNAAIGWDKVETIALFAGLAFIYTMLSGLWGVALTDMVQYILAQIGAIAFAIFAVKEVGGLSILHKTLIERGEAAKLAMMPDPGTAAMASADWWTPAFLGFLVYTGITWWANVNSDGGGKIIQRQNACKNEQHAFLATLWYSLTNLAFRTWPWVIVALCTLIIYPVVDDPEMAYPNLMMKVMPSGWLGVMVASLLAAFMSTVSTQLNWGASYLVHDFYRHFLVKDKDEKHYLRAGKYATVLVLIAAGLAAYYTSSVTEAFKFVIAFGAGTGPVYILRWFWWRINAWSEIAAMAASSVITVALFSAGPMYFGLKLLIITFGSMAIWLSATFLTKPAPMGQLIEFYRRTSPPGFWAPVAEHCRKHGLTLPKTQSLKTPARGFAWGFLFVFGLTLGLGYLLMLNNLWAAVWFVLMVVGFWGLKRDGYLRTS
ncbi:MAG: Na+:solute symporter [Calditrichaeota bacterium]|nr:Na+:solute symporter [Calditrichota bacterium]MCB9369189.1 Na+:solute symporter [Calditrichota bacterium]